MRSPIGISESETSDDDKCNREQTSLLFKHPSTSPQGDVDTEKLMQVMGETVRPEGLM